MDQMKVLETSLIVCLEHGLGLLKAVFSRLCSKLCRSHLEHM